MEKLITVIVLLITLNATAQSVCCDYTECTTTWLPNRTNPFNTITVCVEGDVCHPIDCNEANQ